MKIFVSTVIGVVATVSIVGFFVAGSPQAARLRKFDGIRVQHLQTIQSEIVNFWQAKSRLPERLEELDDAVRGFRVPFDPETGVGYEFGRTSDTQFFVCATFAMSSKNQEDGYSANAPRPAYPGEYGPVYPFFAGGFNWEHGAGRVCFERTIDPDFFQPPTSRKASD